MACEQDSDTQLLTILSNEIARDGGASLATLIKDYYVQRPKLVDSLLHRTVGSKQLLKFFERHPNIFSTDRTKSAHAVKLLSDKYVDCNSLALSCDATDEISSQRQALHDRVVYVLRKRNSLVARRQRNDDTIIVSCEWLLRQCKVPLHMYLRSVGYYMNHRRGCAFDAAFPLFGSSEWENSVMPLFKSLLENWVSFMPSLDKVFLETDADIDDGMSVRALAEKLKEAVDNDGATRISLALLLHREPGLKQMLGGRDLHGLVQNYPEFFVGLMITVNERREVFLQSTQQRIGRMQVDETGLFSVASSRWSSAMANMLANQCRLTLKRNSTDTLAVDLTASVGGVTLGLAKRFARVIAVEIDPVRADLCLKNMHKYGVSKKVDIRNADAMSEIEVLPSNSVVFLDPPWGGHDYKRENSPLMMGSWSFEDVLAKVQSCMHPCICGMRLPVTYQANGWLESLSSKGLEFEVLRSKRMGPQYFVCLQL